MFQAFETGVSDHHKLIPTIVKSSIFKGRLQKKINQSYKNFDNEYFTKSLTEELETLESDAYGQFKRKLLIF